MTVPRFGVDYTSPIEAHRLVTESLVRMIWLKYGKSLDAVPTLAELKALPTRALDDRGSWTPELCFVQNMRRVYAFEAFSTDADDGDTILLPGDKVSAMAGRWHAAPFFDPPGPFHRHFLQHVGRAHNRIAAWSANPEVPSLLQLCSGNLPAVFVCHTGSTPQDVPSQEQAMVERRWHRFTLKVLAKNLRGAEAAAFGSPVEAEEAEDGSAAEIIGRLQWLLRRHAQGLLGTPGVGIVRVGAHSPAGVWGPDLMLQENLDLEVQVSSSVFLEEAEVHRLDGFDVQPQVAEAGVQHPAGPPWRIP